MSLKLIFFLYLGVEHGLNPFCVLDMPTWNESQWPTLISYYWPGAGLNALHTSSHSSPINNLIKKDKIDITITFFLLMRKLRHAEAKQLPHDYIESN